MTVDVILITYNQEKYVAQAVESILMQRVNDDVLVRVIVADDGSTDKTLDIIKSYEDNSPFPFVYLETEKNLGIAYNYKRAFEASNGDYVAILEGDDWWCDVNRLQKHVDCLLTHTEVCYTKNALYLYSEKYNTWRAQFDENNIVVTLNDLVFDNQLVGNLSSCVFRGSMLQTLCEDVYKFSAAMGGGCDWFMGLTILQYGVGYFLSDFMSIYRIDTGENVSRKEMAKEEELAFLKKWYNYADQLLSYRYSNYFSQLYQNKKNEITKHHRYILTTRLEQYIPPIFVWVYKISCNIYDNFKIIIKLFIPRKLYKLWKK